MECLLLVPEYLKLISRKYNHFS